MCVDPKAGDVDSIASEKEREEGNGSLSVRIEKKDVLEPCTGWLLLLTHKYF